MPATTIVTVSEYLATNYRPDRDYVDGIVLERNLGEQDHSYLQMMIAGYLHARSREFGIYVFPEQRVQVKPTRFRIPDVCVVVGARPLEEIFIHPPFLCIEILSKTDRMSEMQERVQDYLDFGVPYVWVLDPRLKRAWVYTRDGMHEPADRILRTAAHEIAVPLAEIFA